ncbi:MAG: ferrous iron transport protein B, partial [Gammaproteobacteria bacterium]|nr:ferrous iron transport protein B [Gammaproteobacteria bacterium]
HIVESCPLDPTLLQRQRDKIEAISGEDIEIHIADSRYSHAHALAKSAIRHRGRIGATTTDHIDRLVLDRYLGVPVFLFVMYLMFMFTINIGGAFIDFFDQLGEAVFVDGISNALGALHAPQWLQVVLASGVGGGLQIVATFIPIITALYLFLSFIEDSGYMARAAFVMDRFMRSIGLPGKAFVPLIVGFGCNVPAVMATRTLENERERKLTILMNPFMSCGARLPVYALFAAAFFLQNGQNLVFLLYLIGILVAILTGMIMKQSLLSGVSSGFMLELPSYHMPTLKGIALHTWDRVRHFIRDAGRTIVLMVVVLNVLNSMGADGSFGNQETDKSLLAVVSQQLTPVFAPMGIHEDNWPAVLGIVTGILAKEVVVSTLDTLYSQIDEEQGLTDASASQSFGDKLRNAAATIPANLGLLGNRLADPLAMDVGDLSDHSSAAEAQQVHTRTFGAMTSRFDGQAGAFAYLLFILLYFPCVATIAAIRREAGVSWAVFVAFWTTAMAYSVASGYYQIATWSEHSAFSTAWILGTFALLGATVFSLRKWARRGLTMPLAERSTR